MSDLLHMNGKFVTIRNKFSKIPPSTSAHFATGVRRSCVVRLGWSSGFFMRVAASKMRASSSPRASMFLSKTSLHIQPHKQICNRVRSEDSNSCFPGNSDTYSYELFFLQCPIPSPAKIFIFTPESSYIVTSALKRAVPFFIQSIPIGVTLKFITKSSVAHNSVFCECLLSDSQFRPEV